MCCDCFTGLLSGTEDYETMEQRLAKLGFADLLCEEGRILTEVMVNVRLAQGLLELVDQNSDGTWSEISSEGGHGNPLQYPCLENPTDRGTWRVTVHGVAERWTQLEQLSTHVRESPGMLFKNTMFH